MHRIIVKRWKCDWCRATASRKQSIQNHEATCFSNPARRACKTCKHDHKGVIDEESNDCYCELDFMKPDGDSLRDYGAGTTITCRSGCPEWEPKP